MIYKAYSLIKGLWVSGWGLAQSPGFREAGERATYI